LSPSTEPSLVDVRIPTIGPAPYLYESIASVMAQSLPAWRLVVSEDEPGRRQASDASGVSVGSTSTVGR
jgi:hypothetical protein